MTCFVVSGPVAHNHKRVSQFYELRRQVERHKHYGNCKWYIFNVVVKYVLSSELLMKVAN